VLRSLLKTAGAGLYCTKQLLKVNFVSMLLALRWPHIQQTILKGLWIWRFHKEIRMSHGLWKTEAGNSNSTNLYIQRLKLQLHFEEEDKVEFDLVQIKKR